MERFKVSYTHYRVPELVVEQLRKRDLAQGIPQGKHLLPYSRKLKDQFVPSPKGGMTLCRVLDTLSGKRVVGRAVCSYSDNFNYREGRLLAYERAILQLEKQDFSLLQAGKA